MQASCVCCYWRREALKRGVRSAGTRSASSWPIPAPHTGVSSKSALASAFGARHLMEEEGEDEEEEEEEGQEAGGSMGLDAGNAAGPSTSRRRRRASAAAVPSLDFASMLPEELDAEVLKRAWGQLPARHRGNKEALLAQFRGQVSRWRFLLRWVRGQQPAPAPPCSGPCNAWQLAAARGATCAQGAQQAHALPCSPPPHACTQAALQPAVLWLWLQAQSAGELCSISTD